VVMRGNDRAFVNDPLYPFEIHLPAALVDAVRTLVTRFTIQPVMAACELDVSASGIAEALAWMHETGLVLQTSTGELDAACTRGTLAAASFEAHRVDAGADIVWFS
jgi:hypothetical protein